MNAVSKRRPIKFNFHPYHWKDMGHWVEKEDSQGIKRRYLKGIASGLKQDGQGERITRRCVEKMHRLSNEGNLFIFDCPHGVAGTDDIGIITKSEVTPLGEWLIEARLYDEHDGFEENSPTLQKANKLWKQMAGLPPYVDKQGNPAPLQKGFSIEGYIPEGGILSLDKETGQRVIDDIELDGVIITPRPAYTDSVATAVYKALDELMPEKKQALEKSVFEKLSNKLNSGDYGHNFYLQYYGIQDLFQDILEELLRHPKQLDDRLNTVFEPYKRIVSELLKRNINMFFNTDAEEYALQKENRMRMLYLKVSEQYLIRKTQNIHQSMKNKENKYESITNDSKGNGNNRKTNAKRGSATGT